MLKFNQFEKAINAILEQEKTNDEITHAIDVLCPNSYSIFEGARASLDGLLDLLKNLMNDTGDWIDWWLYEDVEKFYYDDDGTSHSVQTIEELYDLLTNANYKLCYVEEFGYDYATLYYASTDAENVWGDDWNDVPYEHNAGGPYDDRSDYDIVKVTIKGCFKTPSYGYINSPYSVEMINEGDVPWIEFTDYNEYNEKLFANSTLKDLLKLEEQRSDVLQIIDL